MVLLSSCDSVDLNNATDGAASGSSASKTCDDYNDDFVALGTKYDLTLSSIGTCEADSDCVAASPRAYCSGKMCTLGCTVAINTKYADKYKAYLSGSDYKSLFDEAKKTCAYAIPDCAPSTNDAGEQAKGWCVQKQCKYSFKP